MKILLDTCALLWIALEPSALSEGAEKALSDDGAELYISAISAFEIGLKYARGKLELPVEPTQWFAEALDLFSITELPVTSEIALTAAALQWAHRDPADRVVAATAIRSGLVVVTSDVALRGFGAVQTCW